MFTKYPILSNTISDFENYSVAAGKEKAITQVPEPTACGTAPTNADLAG